MKKNHERLLKFLNHHTAISSSALASLLNVSSRSIKNYIQEINLEYPELISSNKNGYLLNKNISSYSTNNLLPQNYAERSSYIIKEFFVKHVQSIDIYDLSDVLCLSYSSIKTLIQKMNKDYHKNKITFRCKNEMLTIEGNERDKRRFLSNILYQEAIGHLIDLQILEEMFPLLDIQFLNSLLHDSFESYNCYIHDFGYMNLNLHLTIMLDRIINGHAITESKVLLNKENNELTSLIIQKLTNHYHIQLNDYEKNELCMQINMNMNMCQVNSQEELVQSVGKEIYDMTNDIIDELNQQYQLKIDKETLIHPLSLHFKNLFVRVENNTSLHNPLAFLLQSSCPILYDCGLFISDYLDNNYQLNLSADEVAYIAMHIGANIERQNQDSHKLRCILLCPDYQQTRLQLFNYLLIHFDTQIKIVQSISFEHEIKDTNFDCIFSSIPLKKIYKNVIMISPFITALDIKQVFYQIESIFDKRKLTVLYENFNHFFSEDLFFIDEDGNQNKEQIIHLLYQKLAKKGHVHHDFYRDVLRREEAASTAFGKIAIPHSMKMNAKQTSVAMAISNKGILWNDLSVHIVLLIAINDKDSYLFKELYEAFIALFAQNDFIQKVRNCYSFEDFTHLIYTEE